MSRPPGNRRVKSPCLNCEDRELACHDRCERYKKFKEELQVIKDWRKKTENFEHDDYKLREWPKNGRGGKVWKDHRK